MEAQEAKVSKESVTAAALVTPSGASSRTIPNSRRPMPLTLMGMRVSK